MTNSLKILGACNAEAFSLAFGVRRKLASFPEGRVGPLKGLYRIPTPMLGLEPVGRPIFDYKLPLEITDRFEFESRGQFLNRLFEGNPEYIVIDFWRDCYVPL